MAEYYSNSYDTLRYIFEEETMKESPELAKQVHQAAVNLVGAGGSVEETRAHLRAIKTIVGADGFSAAERTYWFALLEKNGMPQQLIEEIDKFDPASTTIEEIVKPIPKGGMWARELLRGAIRIASVDGYSAREHETTMRTAWALGVAPAVVYTLEAMVALERRIAELGHDKLAKMMPNLYSAIFETEH
jgi:tellurite resistance protein